MLKFRRVRDPLRGQTMTEYALLLAGIAVAAFAGYNSLGSSTNSAVNSASSLLPPVAARAPVQGLAAARGELAAPAIPEAAAMGAADIIMVMAAGANIITFRTPL